MCTLIQSINLNTLPSPNLCSRNRMHGFSRIILGSGGLRLQATHNDYEPPTASHVELSNFVAESMST